MPVLAEPTFVYVVNVISFVSEIVFPETRAAVNSACEVTEMTDILFDCSIAWVLRRLFDCSMDCSIVVDRFRQVLVLGYDCSIVPPQGGCKTKN